ncbi:hypothetical protein Pelo_6484 [Pelomyxa schiedti]|nr:hypothetical protein Pelo_6484 [Pelomyxa schiedti]
MPLMSNEWDINQPIDGDGNSALHLACKGGHVGLARQLLAAGACRDPPIDPNRRNTEEWTPLTLACSQGHVGVVEVLLQHPGVDASKDWPLHVACVWNRANVVALLVRSRRFDVNAVANRVRWIFDGMTPLYAAAYFENLEGLRILLGADGIDATKPEPLGGQTPLDIATEDYARSRNKVVGWYGIPKFEF